MSKANSLPLMKVLFAILFVILLVSTIVFAVLYGLERGRKVVETETSDICLTPYCVKAANLLLESINETADPCENFFEFACGKWLQTQRIPDDSESQDTINILRRELDYVIVDILTMTSSDKTNNIQAIQNARNLYQSCVNEEAIEDAGVDELLVLLNNEFGGWPILKGSSWRDASFNFSNLLFKLREYNHNVIYSCSTSIDDRNSSIYFIRIGQSDLGLDERSNYINETSLNLSYRKFMHDLAHLLTNDTSMIATDVAEIYNFEKALSEFHWTAKEQRARQNETRRTTLNELPDLVRSNIDFIQYLQRLYSLSDITLYSNDTISVSELEYLRNASRIINETSARTIQNYFLWRFMMNRVTNMPKRFRIVRDTFDRYFRGTTSERPRTLVCGNFVNVNMGYAVSKVYIGNYFDENARNQSLEMINNIRHAFVDMLRSSSWMDDESKEKAIRKAFAIDQQIGYPEYLSSENQTELENIYQDYHFDTSYMKNLLKLLQIKSRESFRTLRDIVDRKSWGTSFPTIVNAFYNPPRNHINFPAAILQTPFFHKDAPKYLNYGGIGVIIGHEITHGFDDSGRQYDENGNRIPWWSDETIEKFNERKACIIDQYSNYTVEQIGLQLNGYQTQGENIADNGGLKESFYAWKKANADAEKRLPGLEEFSAEQLFFINYGQIWCSKMTDENAKTRILTGVHSPGRFRVIGPTSNFDEFDRVFNCKPGQGNSRINKCAVW